MAKIYGYKRFRNPVTERVNLSSGVENAAHGAVTLGREHVGAVMEYKVEDKTATILEMKPTTMEANCRYFLLAEVPIPADENDNYFVGAVLESMADIDNLIERNPGQDWAKQFYTLRKEGAK